MAWGGAHGLLASVSTGAISDMEAGFAHFASWRTMLEALAIGLAGVGLFFASKKQGETEQSATRERELEKTA